MNGYLKLGISDNSSYLQKFFRVEAPFIFTKKMKLKSFRTSRKLCKLCDLTAFCLYSCGGLADRYSLNSNNHL